MTDADMFVSISQADRSLYRVLSQTRNVRRLTQTGAKYMTTTWTTTATALRSSPLRKKDRRHVETNWRACRMIVHLNCCILVRPPTARSPESHAGA